MLNTATNRYQQTILTTFTATISNMVCLVLTSHLCYESAKMFDPYPQLHPLIKTVNRLNLLIRIVVTFYTALHRYFRENYETPIKQQLQDIESKYFNKIVQPNKRIGEKIGFLINFKCVVSCYLHAMCFVMFYKVYEMNGLNVLNCMLCIGYSTISNITYMVLFNFFKTLCSICRLLLHLNQQMETIYEELQTPERNLKQLADEMDDIFAIHMQLSIILRKLLVLYQFQLISSRIFTITTNVMAVYYGYVFTFYYRTELLYVVVGIVSYFIVTVDFYLLDLICEMIKECFKNLIEILQRFNDKAVLHKQV